jgi:dihydrofolate synthase / folylpolyglutamate synthase
METQPMIEKEIRKILGFHRANRTSYEPRFMQGLSRAFQFQEKLGLHLLVGGTNGKGSIVTMLSSILQASGKKTGSFVGPHLQRFNERILINGREISSQSFLRLYQSHQEKLRCYEKASGRRTSFFELMLLMAVLYFYEEAVEVVVYEVGLGGKRDATFCLDPYLSILTNISLDHTHILGGNHLAIACEKEGVIHFDREFLWAGEQSLDAFFQRACTLKKARFHRMQQNSKLKTISDISGVRGEFSFKESVLTVQASLRGNHQIENIQTTLRACEILEPRCKISPNHCVNGLQNTNSVCRLELLSSHPLIFVDGSHNLAGIRSLMTWVKHNLPSTQVWIALCIKANKNHREISKELKNCELLLFRPPQGPYLKKKELENNYPSGSYLRGYRQVFKKFFSSKQEAKVLIITGSLHVAASIKHFYHKYSHIGFEELDP